MPAIIDPAGPGGRPISIFESGAILQYLGRKTGKFYPSEERARVEVEQWLFWQMGGVGPMAGQVHHFKNYAKETLTYAINRYVDEVNRLYGVMNGRLKDREFIAGKYSIADMALVGWVNGWPRQGQDIEEFPHLKRWLETMKARPGGSAWHGARPRVAPGHRHEGSESAIGSVRSARAGELSGWPRGDLARWLAAAKPARLAISHQKAEISILAVFQGVSRRHAPQLCVRVHLQFIASFKLSFKFSDHYRAARTKKFRRATGKACCRRGQQAKKFGGFKWLLLKLRPRAQLSRGTRILVSRSA